MSAACPMMMSCLSPHSTRHCCNVFACYFSERKRNIVTLDAALSHSEIFLPASGSTAVKWCNHGHFSNIRSVRFHFNSLLFQLWIREFSINLAVNFGAIHMLRIMEPTMHRRFRGYGKKKQYTNKQDCKENRRKTKSHHGIISTRLRRIKVCWSDQP